jgi:uncharacterized membrane-anchored protein
MNKINRAYSLFLTIILLVTVPFFSPLHGENENQKKKAPKISWEVGPGTAKMKEIAIIEVPEGYLFARGEDTRKIMEFYGNFITNKEVGYLAPETHKWFLVFEFDKVGYVKDDEKDSLDAEKMMEVLRESTEEGNKVRREKGIPLHTMKGWYKEPHYNPKTNNLEWGTIFETSGHDTINYNIRYLGRKGVMEVILVADPDDFSNAMKKANQLLEKYSFSKGNRYSEYVQGDKIAEYGLTALVTGGAVAVAAKSGLLSKFWKIIVAGLVAIGAFFKKIFNRIRGKEEEVVLTDSGSPE